MLEDYGYRFGWERFWGTGSGPMTGVFVDQFASRAGAGAYAEDLARNDAEHYDGVVHENPPESARRLPDAHRRRRGRAGGARAVRRRWPGAATGPFSVSVTSVAGSLEPPRRRSGRSSRSSWTAAAVSGQGPGCGSR